jgi:5-methylcytosine-specific restriction enzyme A
MTRRNWDHGGKSASERGYGAAWQRLRLRILARDNYLCQVCHAKGRTTPATHVDHILAKAKGGTDSEGNCRAICRECHDRKSIEEKGHRVRKAITTEGWLADD